MKTAIVILNYNNRVETVKYANAIKEYSSLDKIVVVDNNSNDEDEYEKLTKKIGDEDKITILKTEKNGGYSYGNNVGIKYIDNTEEDAKYIIISNPDIVVTDETIKKCIDYLDEHENVAIVAPRMMLKDNEYARRSAWKKRTIKRDIASSCRLTETLMFFRFKSGEYSKKKFKEAELKVDAIAGSFFVIRLDVLRKIDYLDENVFLFYEEDILGHKIKELNMDIVSLNDIYFEHLESTTINKVMNRLKKVDILFDSKIYYHEKYNNATKGQIRIFNILRAIRKFEVLIGL